MNVGFDNWEPSIKHDGQEIEKSFDKFREEVTILAGYYYSVHSIYGTVTLKARSISFANMEEYEFERLYNATINVILKQVYNSQLSREALDNIVNQVMSFT